MSRKYIWGAILGLWTIGMFSVILMNVRAEPYDADIQLVSLEDIDQVAEEVEEAVKSALDSLDEIIQDELEENRKLEHILKTVVGKDIKKRRLRVMRRFEKSTGASNKPLIKINHSFGLVKISPWKQKKVMLKALIMVSSSIDNTEAQRLADEIEIKIEGNKDEIIIETKYPKYKQKRGGFEVELAITVPEYSHLNTRNSFGNLVITDILGSLESEIQYGNALIQNCGDDLNVEAKFSSIAVLGIEGDVKINSNFGGVHVANVKGNQQVDNRYGLIETLADTDGGDIVLHNEFGKIELYVPKQFDAQVYASTEFGALKSDLPLDKKRDGFKYYAEGYFGEQQYAKYRQIDLKNRFGEVKISHRDWDFDLEKFWDKVNSSSAGIESEMESPEKSKLEGENALRRNFFATISR